LPNMLGAAGAKPAVFNNCFPPGTGTASSKTVLAGSMILGRLFRMIPCPAMAVDVPMTV